MAGNYPLTPPIKKTEYHVLQHPNGRDYVYFKGIL